MVYYYLKTNIFRPLIRHNAKIFGLHFRKFQALRICDFP